MTKQYIIRHKATQKQLFTQNGNKGTWKTEAHAKAAFTNVYFYSKHRMEFGIDWNGRRRFAEQDQFEVVEVVVPSVANLATAEQLLRQALTHLDNTHGYESELWYDIRAYFGMGDDE